MVAAVQKDPRFSRKWDYGIMLALASALLGSIIYIAGAEIGDHNQAAEAHPTITAQINSNTDSLHRIEANQIRESVMAMDARLCEEPNNQVYRRELTRLISDWEKLTGQTFPRELLRCAR